MTFNDYLVISPKIKNSARIIKRISKKKPVLNCFLVGVYNERLEIYSAMEFVQPVLNALDFDVVGLFESFDEAVEFIRVLSEISVNRFGKPDLIAAVPFYEEVL